MAVFCCSFSCAHVWWGRGCQVPASDPQFSLSIEFVHSARLAGGRARGTLVSLSLHSVGVTVGTTTVNVYPGFRELSLDPPACMTNTLLTEPWPQPSVLVLICLSPKTTDDNFGVPVLVGYLSIFFSKVSVWIFCFHFLLGCLPFCYGVVGIRMHPRIKPSQF